MNARTALIAFLVAFSAFMIYRFAGPSGDGDVVVSQTRSEKIKRVVNANKLKTDKDEYVLFAGIRAPFPNDPSGDDAVNAVREMVEGKRIRMRFGDHQTDKEDRWVAFVFVDGQFVNEEIVRQGLAYVRLKRGEQRFEQELLEAQREARSERRGIWRNRFRKTEDQYIGDRRHASFHRPTCNDVVNIKPGDDVPFSKPDDAFDVGFAPCSHCSPIH